MITTQRRKGLSKKRVSAFQLLFPDLEKPEIHLRLAFCYSNLTSNLSAFRKLLEDPGTESIEDAKCQTKEDGDRKQTETFRERREQFKKASRMLRQVEKFFEGSVTPTKEEVRNLLHTLQHCNVLNEDDTFRAAKRRICCENLWQIITEEAPVDRARMKALNGRQRRPAGAW